MLFLTVWKESHAGCICWEVPIGVTVLSRLVAVSGISGQGWTSRELVSCRGNWLINWISSWVGGKTAAFWEVKLFSWDEKLSWCSLSSLDQILRRKMAFLWLMVPRSVITSVGWSSSAHLMSRMQRRKIIKQSGQPTSQLKDFPVDPGVFPDRRCLPHGFGKHLAFEGPTLGGSDPPSKVLTHLCASIATLLLLVNELWFKDSRPVFCEKQRCLPSCPGDPSGPIPTAQSWSMCMAFAVLPLEQTLVRCLFSRLFLSFENFVYLCIPSP